MKSSQQISQTPGPKASSASTLLLQRKCACGGSAGLAGKCEDCDRRRLAGLQRKLEVSRPGDQFEQEADRVAESVMRMPAPRTQIQTLAPVAPAPSGVTTAPPAVQDALGSPGNPLDTETRAFMESRFGHDFSRVRVHTGARASESARAVLEKLDKQMLNHAEIARTCGLEYRYIVSSERVAERLRQRWFGNVVINVVPFEGCE